MEYHKIGEMIEFQSAEGMRKGLIVRTHGTNDVIFRYVVNVSYGREVIVCAEALSVIPEKEILVDLTDVTGLECDDCGNNCGFETTCPFASEVEDREIEICVCSECYSDREDAV